MSFFLFSTHCGYVLVLWPRLAGLSYSRWTQRFMSIVGMCVSMAYLVAATQFASLPLVRSPVFSMASALRVTADKLSCYSGRVQLVWHMWNHGRLAVRARKTKFFVARGGSSERSCDRRLCNSVARPRSQELWASTTARYRYEFVCLSALPTCEKRIHTRQASPGKADIHSPGRSWRCTSSPSTGQRNECE